MRALARWALVFASSWGLVAGASGAVFAGVRPSATDLFVGSAVSENIVPSSATTGTYIWTYTGAALGSLPGTFRYVEKGTYSMGPAGLVGQQTASEIDLTPRGAGAATIVIPNIDPAGSLYHVATAPVSQLPAGAIGALSALGGPAMVAGGSVTYGTWTFIDDLGTFGGYSTPDFTKIAIRVSFYR